MTDLHAVIGRVQLTKLTDWTKAHQVNVQLSDSELKGVQVPTVALSATHVDHQHTIRGLGHDRERFQAKLANRGVDLGFTIRSGDLPNTTLAAKECLSLPAHPGLSELDFELIVTAVNDTVKTGV